MPPAADFIALIRPIGCVPVQILGFKLVHPGRVRKAGVGGLSCASKPLSVWTNACGLIAGGPFTPLGKHVVFGKVSKGACPP